MQVQSKKEELLANIAELEVQYAQLRAETLTLWERHIRLTRTLPPDLLQVNFTIEIFRPGPRKRDNHANRALRLC